ncbi:RrF2 family transcriptional regulator [Microcoleus sp. FACHB-672]|uniref:RrF2 family transcriptional regulator n=1 Tax=Microcoleus sp. FACHB-672 TaxID=2692825 RepID=UPI001686A92F|nr:Rrf2 family transcriptional regulator [Microcoleus sp. FACHB-672]MBD2039356.1 Rrf2 family transcriptional regulator [Microcoleus sp. FACHB-672]
MELSCKVKYAMVALLELASRYGHGEPVQISQIAASQQIPDRYLEQLLTTLRRGGFVRSQRGSKGGYLLAKPPWQIPLLEVFDCLEGPQSVEHDGQSDSVPTPESAALQEVWTESNLAAQEVLRRYSLQDLCLKRDDCQRLNIMYYI